MALQKPSRYKVIAPVANIFEVGTMGGFKVLKAISKIPQGGIFEGYPTKVKTQSVKNGLWYTQNVIQIAGDNKFVGKYVLSSSVVAIPYSKAEGESSSEQKPATQTTTQIKSTMKNILTNKNMLVGAGIGAGTGLVLGWLLGVKGGNMFGITVTTAVIGGLIGNGGESFSGAEGRKRRSESKKWCRHENPDGTLTKYICPEN